MDWGGAAAASDDIEPPATAPPPPPSPSPLDPFADVSSSSSRASPLPLVPMIVEPTAAIAVGSPLISFSPLASAPPPPPMLDLLALSPVGPAAVAPVAASASTFPTSSSSPSSTAIGELLSFSPVASTTTVAAAPHSAPPPLSSFAEDVFGLTMAPTPWPPSAVEAPNDEDDDNAAAASEDGAASIGLPVTAASSMAPHVVVHEAPHSAPGALETSTMFDVGASSADAPSAVTTTGFPDEHDDLHRAPTPVDDVTSADSDTPAGGMMDDAATTGTTDDALMAPGATFASDAPPLVASSLHSCDAVSPGTEEPDSASPTDSAWEEVSADEPRIHEDDADPWSTAPAATAPCSSTSTTPTTKAQAVDAAFSESPDASNVHAQQPGDPASAFGFDFEDDRDIEEVYSSIHSPEPEADECHSPAEVVDAAAQDDSSSEMPVATTSPVASSFAFIHLTSSPPASPAQDQTQASDTFLIADSSDIVSSDRDHDDDYQEAHGSEVEESTIPSADDMDEPETQQARPEPYAGGKVESLVPQIERVHDEREQGEVDTSVVEEPVIAGAKEAEFKSHSASTTSHAEIVIDERSAAPFTASCGDDGSPSTVFELRGPVTDDSAGFGGFSQAPVEAEIDEFGGFSTADFGEFSSSPAEGQDRIAGARATSASLDSAGFGGFSATPVAAIDSEFGGFTTATADDFGGFSSSVAMESSGDDEFGGFATSTTQWGNTSNASDDDFGDFTAPQSTQHAESAWSDPVAPQSTTWQVDEEPSVIDIDAFVADAFPNGGLSSLSSSLRSDAHPPVRRSSVSIGHATFDTSKYPAMQDAFVEAIKAYKIQLQPLPGSGAPFNSDPAHAKYLKYVLTEKLNEASRHDGVFPQGSEKYNLFQAIANSGHVENMHGALVELQEALFQSSINESMMRIAKQAALSAKAKIAEQAAQQQAHARGSLLATTRHFLSRGSHSNGSSFSNSATGEKEGTTASTPTASKSARPSAGSDADHGGHSSGYGSGEDTGSDASGGEGGRESEGELSGGASPPTSVPTSIGRTGGLMKKFHDRFSPFTSSRQRTRVVCLRRAGKSTEDIHKMELNMETINGGFDEVKWRCAGFLYDPEEVTRLAPSQIKIFSYPGNQLLSGKSDRSVLSKFFKPGTVWAIDIGLDED